MQKPPAVRSYVKLENSDERCGRADKWEKEVDLAELETKANLTHILKHYKITPEELAISSLSDAIVCRIATRDAPHFSSSGMDKTAVFVLSTLQQIEPTASQVAALVMCRTRELAFQICHEFERFSTYLLDIKIVDSALHFT
ncbi:hypothetical protein ZIOFF_026509 [Zingiber officinale]|uniref:DEAD/DEAH-box helicase domain-containing protein n=1 Tax=Zingiber officinale TaxID=94328 RepID=A0A8J5LET7_ZINOF|nr:hypothetical protein ZIOFF_026509 [Zingiber officinale]